MKMNMIYLYVIFLLSMNCDTPETYICPNGQIMDDCGNCRDCETDECGWNDIMDDCGECGGDNTSCIECTDPAASNFGSNQDFTIECRIRTNITGDVSIIGNKDWTSGSNPEKNAASLF